MSASPPRLPVETESPAISRRAAAADDPRIGDLIGAQLEPGEWPAIALIGFPCEEGVRRNHGRAGASEAPDRIRHWFYRLTPGHDRRLAAIVGRTHDFGNLRAGEDLEAAQAQLGEAVAACLARGTLPIVLGGGHETAFGHFLGYVAAERPVAILNWDAHADVRPLVDGRGHSGSPFRQALEHPSGCCRGYAVAGLLPHAVSAEHLEYVARHGRSLWRDATTVASIAELYARPPVERRRAAERLAPGIVRPPSGERPEPGLLVSFDLDAVDQAFAPGVSAPATGGLTIDLWLEAARQAGRSAQVSSLDIVEVNPRVDRDDQTSRLASLTIWTFLCGVAERADWRG